MKIIEITIYEACDGVRLVRAKSGVQMIGEWWVGKDNLKELTIKVTPDAVQTDAVT